MVAQLIVRATLLCILGAPIARAEQILICKSTEKPRLVATLKLDLERNAMSWGQLSFVIISKKNDFITARTADATLNVGGEIWVIHQLTGGYKRASVSWSCTDPTMLSCSLTTATDHGTCHQN
jgi:hypothetical protein